MNYFITVFRAKDHRDHRTWGYYRNFNYAEQAILENWTDMFEDGYYDLALIEQVKEGLLQYADKEERWWYRTYIDIDGNIQVGRTEQPDWAIKIVGYCFS